jgi:hypothetical protein
VGRGAPSCRRTHSHRHGSGGADEAPSLRASGVHASLFDATAVLIAVAVLGALPVGPGVGAGAMVLILGSNGVAGVTAAGVLLTATGTLGALAYAGWALADRLWTKRRTRLRLRASATGRQAPAST